MKVHILESFPGESKGKTKDVEEHTANVLINSGYAVEAKGNSPHPETKEGIALAKAEGEKVEAAKAKQHEQAQARLNKEDKTATETKTK